METDLNKVLKYVNNSANKARDLMFHENTDNTRHITTIIVCEQVAKFVKKLQNPKKAQTSSEKLKNYRVIKEFFVEANDEFEAEKKANYKELQSNLIDVQEAVDE
jgi:hypothetical protein